MKAIPFPVKLSPNDGYLILQGDCNSMMFSCPIYLWFRETLKIWSASTPEELGSFDVSCPLILKILYSDVAIFWNIIVIMFLVMMYYYEKVQAIDLILLWILWTFFVNSTNDSGLFVVQVKYVQC